MSQHGVMERSAQADEPGAPHSALRSGLASAFRLLLAAAGGLAMWTAFPGLDLWWAAPVGVAVWAGVMRGRRAREAALLGLVFGLAMYIPLLSWSGIFVGRLPWFALALIESLYLVLASAAMPHAWRLLAVRGGPALVALAGSGLWVAQEAVRSRAPFGGFPWARLAFSQTDAPSLGLASLGGAPTVSGIVAMVGVLLAVTAHALVDLARHSQDPSFDDITRPLLPALGAAALMVIGVFVPRPVTGDSLLSVAAIQGNVPRAGLDFNAERRAVLDNHAAATRELADAVARGAVQAPAVVFWPENSSDIDPLRNADAHAVIQTAADTVGAPVVVGAVLQPSPKTLTNTVIVWGPKSGAGAPPGPGESYSKVHPAPFAEYIPLRSFVRHFNSNVDRITNEFIPGSTAPRLKTAGAVIGPAICFEVAYDNLIRDAVLSGAELLYVPTNNATFGRSSESVQQLAMSRLRAVETGRAVVHISTVGVSALIEPDGRVIESSDLFTRAVLSAELPLRHDLTVATRLGSAPEWAWVAAALVLVMLSRRVGTNVKATK